MTELPRVSVIVPAPELTDDGRRCLERLTELGEQVEVLFVPDAQVDDLPAGVECVVSGPVLPGEKRQLALERSSGALIALIDDDAYPHPGWLDEVAAAFAADAAIGAVCGPTITPDDAPEGEQLSGRVYASWLVSGPQVWRYRLARARDVDDAPSVNLVFRREDALAIRFDSPYWPGEDTIVCNRLIRRGRRIRYVPGAYVFHRRRSLWRGHLLQVWRFGCQRGAFARTIGGNSAQPGYFAPSLLMILLSLGWIGSPRWWRRGVVAYGAACLASGADRDPRRWWRISAAIAATNACYGIGVLLGLARGVREGDIEVAEAQHKSDHRPAREPRPAASFARSVQ